MKRWAAFLLIMVVAVLACGGTDSGATDEPVGATTHALSGTGILPEPCGDQHWSGTAIDLMVADALTACSGDDGGTPDQPGDDGFFANGGGPMRDGYLTYVRGRMMETLGMLPDPPPNPLLTKAWAEFRAKSSEGEGDAEVKFNCDPITGNPKAATITPRYIGERIPWAGLAFTPKNRKALANDQLRSPAFHLCLAQVLRSMVPGAAGGEALLLSEQDQRSLLETIRENAQIAMLDYAQLGTLFTTLYPYPGTAPPSTLAQGRYLPEIQWWALSTGSGGSDPENTPLKQMGRDFAAAVQLHSVVSEELAGLLVRNRSARTPRGGDPKDRADELWGSGSWNQRLLASMMGGDPLANPADKPWPRPDQNLLPPNSGDSGFVFDIPGPPAASGHADGWDWPNANRAPYVSTALREPQVLELLRLAKRFDRVQMRLKRNLLMGNYAVCDGFDLDGSATDLYEWVEGELRRATCYDEDGNPDTPTCCETNTCGPATKPAQPFPNEKYLLWERYRIRPEHAETLVRYLADNINYEKLGVTPATGYGGQYQLAWCNRRASLADPDYRAGAQLIAGKMWFQVEAGNPPGFSMRLTAKLPGDDSDTTGPEVSFMDRPLRDVAPAYTRNAVLRFAGPWELAIRATASGQGFIGNCLPLPANPGCPESSQDAKRLMGATSALAATRFLLMASLGHLKTQGSNLPNEQARLTDYFVHAQDILKIMDGGVGAESVGLRPVSQISTNAQTNTQTVTVARDSSNDPLWEVDVTFGQGDSFWNEASGSAYTVCAVAHPAAANLALNPGSKFGSTTIDALIATATGAHRCAAGAFWSQLAGFSAMLDAYDGAPRGWSTLKLRLPVGTDEALTLVAYREDEAVGRRYQVLGSSFSINDTTKLPQGHFIATGGTLGDLVSKAIQGRTENPTEPKYDGFGLRTDWVPPFTAELIGGTSEEASADRYLALAKSSADEATAAVNDAMERLIQEDKDDATMSAATQRWQQGMKEEQEKLCGPSNAECNVEPPVLTALDAGWFANEPPYVSCMWYAPDCVGDREQCLAECGPDQPTCDASCGADCESACYGTCHATCFADCMAGVGGNPLFEDACNQACAGSCPQSCADQCSLGCTECQHQCTQQCDADLIGCQAHVAQHDIDCFASSVTSAVLGTPAHISQAVLDTIQPSAGAPPVPPTFDEYFGGKLQTALVEQWRAIRAIDDRFLVLTTTAAAAKGRVAVSYAALQDADENAANQCDPVRLSNALKSGLSASCAGDVNYTLSTAEGFHCEGDQASMSYSAGQYYAQLDRCYDASAGLDTPRQQALSSVSDAMAALAAAASGMTDAQAAVMISGSEIATLLNDARLAKSRYDLEKKLSADGLLTTSFGLYRRYRSYDVWRAKALVENARRYALAARRSVEARYVVNLSEISQPEAFVQSPSTWSDEVYGYDLSLPAAVGLSVGTEQQGGIYPNKVGDYVSNLTSFVMGYAVSRPAAVAREEVEVVNLAGLKQGDGVDFGGLGGTDHPEVGTWVLRCPNGDDSYEWRHVTSDWPASGTCRINDKFVRPDRARLSFELDPWGRLNGTIANEPYALRYNGRWGMLAVNFVGTGIKDCEQSPDPYACYSEGFIRYDLSHVGPAWITDYDGVWRILGVPVGRIEGAKGLASELWLDPLKDGWNTPYISAVTRTEFQLRPLGGAYELEFEITPEIDIDKIDRVQLLIGSTYWVKQD